MQLVTPALKDKLLFYLCYNKPLEQIIYISTKELQENVDASHSELKAIFYQFERFGFLKEVGIGDENSSFKILVELHDFANAGGFEVQETILKGNIEKLGFEVDNLRKQLGPEHLDTVNKISSIASAIFSGLSLLPKATP